MGRPLSYNKWAIIEDAESDDDGQKEARPLGALGHAKSKEQHEADNILYDKFRGYLKTHFKGKYPLSQRKLLARFIAIQDKVDQSSNIYRYNDIIGLATQVALRCVSLSRCMHTALKSVHYHRHRQCSGPVIPPPPHLYHASFFVRIRTSTSTHACHRILHLLLQRMSELMDRALVNLLCELHKTMLNETKVSDKDNPVVQDAKVHYTLMLLVGSLAYTWLFACRL